MVDVGEKDVTARRAVATGQIQMQASTLSMISDGEHPKGDVLAVARVAAIMAAKRTAETIPLCHPIFLTRVEVAFKLDPEHSRVDCSVITETRERTGVEMEALTAVCVAGLTVYDMCKAVDRSMVISAVKLLQKSGGLSGDWSEAS